MRSHQLMNKLQKTGERTFAPIAAAVCRRLDRDLQHISSRLARFKRALLCRSLLKPPNRFPRGRRGLCIPPGATGFGSTGPCGNCPRRGPTARRPPNSPAFPARLSRGVPHDRVSADVPFPPSRRAAARAFQEGLRERDGHDQRRQRGDGGGHDDAVAAGPGRRLAPAPRFARPSAARGHALSVVLPVHGQRREPARTAARATPITATRPRGGCR